MKKLGIWFGLLCILQGVVPMQVVAQTLTETKGSVNSEAVSETDIRSDTSLTSSTEEINLS